eukprot:c40182_g1_i1 orf=1-315(-)
MAEPITVIVTPLNFTLVAPRGVMQVYLTIVKAKNLLKKRGSIRVSLQLWRKCSDFRLETPSVPLSKAVWKHTWKFQAEKSTDSLKLQLLRRHHSTITQNLDGSEF